MARQKLFVKTSTPKSDFIKFRVRPEQKELLEQKAADAGMTLTDYLITAGMNRPMRSRIAATIINDMRVLSLEVKRLASGQGAHDQEYLDALQAIKTAMLKVWNKEIDL